MIGFRADGNKTIGIGHIMRCLTYAEAFREKGEEVMFLVSPDETCEKLIRERGFCCERIPFSYENKREESEFLRDKIQELGIELLFTDSYYVTEDYFNTLREHVKILYLDDRNAFDYPVDMVVNYNISAEEEVYGGSAVKYLTGPAYAPVRKEFLSHHKAPLAGKKKFFVSVGGSDTGELPFVLAECVKAYVPDCELHIVARLFGGNRDAADSFCRKYKDVFFYENVKEIWKIMENCNVAISAGGSTMYELSAMGFPMITFWFAENQKKVAEGFGKKGAAFYAGEYAPDKKESFCRNLAEQLNALDVENNATETGNRAGSTVDGKGAGRLAEEVISLIKK